MCLLQLVFTDLLLMRGFSIGRTRPVVEYAYGSNVPEGSKSPGCDFAIEGNERTRRQRIKGEMSGD